MAAVRLTLQETGQFTETRESATSLETVKLTIQSTYKENMTSLELACHPYNQVEVV